MIEEPLRSPNKVVVIAEAGVNHNGSLSLAKQLIFEAAKAGADFVKFQSFSADKILSKDTPKAEYQKLSTDPGENQYDMLKKLELSRADHEELINECRNQRIGFLSTAFDCESFDMLVSLGLGYVKIPSGELTNLPFLRHVARLEKPLILSTGMATLDEVEMAINAIEASGTPKKLITILHCTTEYPAPMREVNLKAMITMKLAFGTNVGYSDHTLGIEASIAAVAMGATMIEKHFTIDRALSGPDHQASLEPNELTAMIDAIRNIEYALGDGTKRPSESEVKNRAVARRSLVAIKKIRPGELFTAENVGAKRPGTGISPMQWDDVIGRVAAKSFDIDELIVI